MKLFKDLPTCIYCNKHIFPTLEAAQEAIDKYPQLKLKDYYLCKGNKRFIHVTSQGIKELGSSRYQTADDVILIMEKTYKTKGTVDFTVSEVQELLNSRPGRRTTSKDAINRAFRHLKLHEKIVSTGNMRSTGGPGRKAECFSLPAILDKETAPSVPAKKKEEVSVASSPVIPNPREASIENSNLLMKKLDGVINLTTELSGKFGPLCRSEDIAHVDNAVDMINERISSLITLVEDFKSNSSDKETYKEGFREGFKEGMDTAIRMGLTKA